MTSKLKKNLTALFVVAAFLGASTLLGEPIESAEADALASTQQCPGPAHGADLPKVATLPMKLQLTMPYLSLPRVVARQQES